MAQIHANTEPIQFDDATADALKRALDAAANAVSGQAGSRQTAVNTASQEFRGRFSELFTQNASTAAGDGRTIVETLRNIAGWVDTMKEAAAAERARRKTAREWQAREDARSGIEEWWTEAWQLDPMPKAGNEPAPTFPAPNVTARPRETPDPGAGGGGGGGTSSARPADLRSFASACSGMNRDLDGKPAVVRGALQDFAARCSWGHIDAGNLVSAFEQWLAANDRDVQWANTVADAFAAAGGEGTVSTVADSALAAALQAAGVAATRSELQFDPPSAYGAQPTTGFSMDPVNTTTGNFLEPETDLDFPGSSPSLRITRMYNSLDDRAGLFGPGWASVLETRLELDDDGASFVGADGRQVRFPRAADGWERGVGENRWLVAEQDLLVVRDNSGGRIEFTRSGVWLGERGGPGTAVRVERDEDGSVRRLVHVRGRAIDVEYASGRVAVVRSSDGRRVEYEYDDRGRLVSVVGAAGARRYGWNDDDLVTTVTSADGVVEVHNTYDDHRRVVEQVSPHGRAVRFAYLPGRVTVVSDHDGSRSNSYLADAKGRLVGVVDSDDHRQSMSYDRHGNLVSVTERDGSVTVHAYDERGRRIRTVTPSGGDVTYGYDDQDRTTTVVAESGGVVTYEYRGDDRDPSVITDPLGGRTELTWSDGLLTRVVDPTGVVLSLEHDEHGELVATTNAVGDTARIERDPAGRPTAVTSPSGARTEYRYDGAGLLRERRDPDGATWRFEHTAAGRVSTVTDPLGGTTTFEYGPDGELHARTDPLGRRVLRSFDDQGNLASLTLPGDAVWTFAHDALSRLLAVSDPTGATSRREYDANGKLTATIDPTGVRQDVARDVATGVATLRDAFSTTTVRFDEFGRPVESTSAEAGSELVTYDAAGRPVELVDGEGGLTRIERDLAGRVTAVVAPSGARTAYEYDTCGRPSAAVDATGARTTLTYDVDSRVVARTSPTGDVERTTYDAVGRVVERTTTGAGTSRYRWDAAGRLVSVHDARFGRRRFRHDAAGQVVEVVDGLGGVTRHEYDERGRVVATTDPAGGVTRREYDQADRLVAVTDPLGRRTAVRLDTAGRRVEQTDPDGRTTAWTYDGAGREHQVLVDGQVQTEVRRDPVGRTVVVTDHTRGAGLTVDHELEYDRRGLLVRRSRGAGAIRWEYDADGRRSARTDPSGTRTTWRRDAAGRATAVERDRLGAATFRYDASGRIVESVTGDLVQSWSYEHGALVAHKTTSSDGVTTTRIERDDDGRITAIDGPRGRVEHRYDDAGQLVRADDSEWEYDAGGRLVRELVDGTETRSTYDLAGELVATERAGVRTEYRYDGLGRRVRRSDADGSTVEYTWSALGTLAGITSRDPSYAETGRTDLWTDALGELASVSGAEAWWDSAADVPGLVSLGGADVLDLPGGVVVVDDTWTTPGWRSARATDPSDPWAVLEAVGSATLSNGVAVLAGVALTASGGVSVAGLEWLGARVYDPAARGFLSTDPLSPVLGAAWSANPYSYAGNDPVHAVDPLGLRPATDADIQAYRDANQGAFGELRDFADEHADFISAAGIVLGVAATVVVMCSPLGPLAAIAVAAGGGAALAGGMSIQSNKGKDGKVDWGAVGVDTLIGGAAGALGGATSLGLSKAVPAMARSGIGLVSRVGASRALGTAGQSAISGGVQGAASNVADYGVKNGWQGDVGGYLGAGGTGAATGAGFSALSSAISPRLGSAMTDNLHLDRLFASSNAGRHVDLSGLPASVQAADAVAAKAVDAGIGGASSLVNEIIRPGGDASKDNLTRTFWSGVIGGAEGPDVRPPSASHRG